MDKMESPLPFSEKRRVVGSVDVSLWISDLASLPRQSSTDLRRYPLPGSGPDGCVKLHMDGNTPHWCLQVHVEGIPNNADVWIKGEFEWKVKCYEATGSNIKTSVPFTPCRPTWLRGNGCLGSFVLEQTQSLLGKVVLYGAAEGDDPKPNLSLIQIRQHTALCDVVLRAAGRDFPAHKVVLATRSPVMLTMFTSDFKEAKDKVVDIAVDCSAEVFDVFVDYLYSGAVDSGFLKRISCGDLLDLLELAERYLVADLKAVCVKQLCGVGDEEALEVLQASLEKPFVPDECRENAFLLVRKNWATVSASDEWVKFRTAHSEFALAVECMMKVV